MMARETTGSPLMSKSSRIMQERLKDEIARNQKSSNRCGGGMAVDQEADAPRTMLDSIQSRLVFRRDRLIEEIQDVEKALQIASSDSRVRELDSLLVKLGI